MSELLVGQILVAKKFNCSIEPLIYFCKNCEYKIAKICRNKIAIIDENRKKIWFQFNNYDLGTYIWYWFRRKN